MLWAFGGPATFHGPKLLTGGPPGPERAHGALALPAPGCTPRRPGVLGRAAGSLQPQPADYNLQASCDWTVFSRKQ